MAQKFGKMSSDTLSFPEPLPRVSFRDTVTIPPRVSLII